MKLTIRIRDDFGPFCADGEAAAEFRFRRVDPYASAAETIEFDFEGVRNANSSFCNALIANLVAKNSEEIIQRLRFCNCRENVKIMIQAALALGVSRARERGKPEAFAHN